MHSSASETYFLELSYHSLPANYTMPIDEYGKAHIFDIVDEMVNIHNSKPSTSEMPEAQLASKLSASTQHFLGLRLCFHTRKKVLSCNMFVADWGFPIDMFDLWIE